MNVDIVVPQIGEAVSELRLVSWHKKIGDPIQIGDVLFDVDSDKAVVDVEAFSEGTLAEILLPDGSSVMPLQVVGRIQPLGLTTSAPTQSPEPVVASSDDSRVIVSPVARRVAADLSVDTARIKGTGANGRITAEDVRRHAQIGAITTNATAFPSRLIASPKAKRLARERGLSLTNVIGTGVGGLIVSRDLPAETPPAAPAPSITSDQPDLLPLTKLRQTTASRTQASKQQAPHFYLMVDADMTQANALRQYCTATLGWDRPPTYTDLLVRASALAIAALPEVNRSYNDQGLIQRRSIGVGVAVATDAGLLLPVLPQANQRSLAQLSAELRAAIARAREGRLKPTDMGEKSISISNLGMYNVDRFIPIIDLPDPMMLAVGRVADPLRADQRSARDPAAVYADALRRSSRA
ncbi:MAG: 2-oxo acid dehydrogenase subunit E2 [Anaerolineae bacterium]